MQLAVKTKGKKSIEWEMAYLVQFVKHKGSY